MAYKDLILSDGPKWYCPLDETTGSLVSVYNVIPATDERLDRNITGSTNPATSGVSGIQLRHTSSSPGTYFRTITANSNWSGPVKTSGKITVEGWVNNQLQDAFFRGGDWGDFDYNPPIQVGWTAGDFIFAKWVVDPVLGGTTTLAAPIPSSGGLHHIVFTHDGTTATLYMDGRVMIARDLPFLILDYNQPNTNTYTVIGHGVATSATVPNVVIDDIAVYSSALSIATIQSHCTYRSSLGSTIPAPASAAHAAARESDHLLEYYEAIPGSPARELNWNIGAVGDTPPTNYFRTDNRGTPQWSITTADILTPEANIFRKEETLEAVVAGKVPRSIGATPPIISGYFGEIRWNTVGKDPRETEVDLVLAFNNEEAVRTVTGDWCDRAWHHIALILSVANPLSGFNMNYALWVDGTLELSGISTKDYQDEGSGGGPGGGMGVIATDTTPTSFGKDRRSFRTHSSAYYIRALDPAEFTDRVAAVAAMPPAFPPDPPRGEVGGTLYI